MDSKRTRFTCRHLKQVYRDVYLLNEFLDWIVLKNKEYVPETSYESATDLSIPLTFTGSLIVAVSWKVKRDAFPSRVAFSSAALAVDICATLQKAIEKKVIRHAPVEYRNLECFSVDHWLRLCHIMGDSWMTFLLNTCALFVVLPSKCVHQLSGTPIKNMAWQSREETEQSRNCSALHRDPRDVLHVPWHEYLYSRSRKASFPKTNLITTLAAKVRDQNEGASEELVKAMFQEWMTTATEQELSILLDRNESHKIRMLAAAFLKKHKRYPYRDRYRVHCHEPEERTRQSYCDILRVNQFIRGIIHRVIPRDLLGSARNVKALQRFCFYFLRLSVKSQPSMDRLMDILHVSDCRWIPSAFAAQPDQQRQMAAALFKWLIISYLVPCLRGFFYITEMGNKWKTAFFFPKETWCRLHDTFLEGMVAGHRYEEVTERVSEEQDTETFVVSNVRMCPKASSVLAMRPIINLKSAIKLQTVIREKLAVWLAVLQYVLEVDCGFSGVAITTSDFGIHALWKRFAQFHTMEHPDRWKLRNCGIETVSWRPLYFVKADLVNCFPSMELSQLKVVLRRIVDAHGGRMLRVHRYCVILSRNGRTTWEYKYVVTPESQTFQEFLLNTEWKEEVVVALPPGNSKVKTHGSLASLMEGLPAHLSSIIVKSGPRHFKIIKGVTQGHQLSAVLCNLYYGHMENELLQDFLPNVSFPNEFLARIVDDYLFVTPDRDRVESFLRIMSEDVVRMGYNSKLNFEKTSIYFPSAGKGVTEERIWGTVVSNSPTFSWFGLLWDTRNLQVMVDYERLQRTGKLMHSFTFDFNKGLAGLKRKLLSVSYLKKSMLFDGSFQSERTIARNLYQVAVITSLRLHALAANLSKREGMQHCHKAYSRIILGWCKCMARRLLRQHNINKITYPLCVSESQWISLRAFIQDYRLPRAVRKPLIEAHRKLEEGLSLQRRQMFSKSLLGMFPFKDDREKRQRKSHRPK